VGLGCEVCDSVCSCGRGGRGDTFASAGEGHSQKPDMQGEHEHKELGWGERGCWGTTSTLASGWG